ncbi:hypothetical protein BU14_0033s0022 [Porphyra umbilicalis]|uniref:Uncharacterized protein n=1 Tax=Porphyra umbilicalis TaxID=2786 RepID=A0A1X6PJ01_PORUM|nr:hypothetical protein BU14_0033s0022 [Porphyra umbilicalis]|eukprot:OSX80678.1 hypothetical protein BU14_0033s0022 [Porphyra umbilicalis]
MCALPIHPHQPLCPSKPRCQPPPPRRTPLTARTRSEKTALPQSGPHPAPWAWWPCPHSESGCARRRVRAAVAAPGRRRCAPTAAPGGTGSDSLASLLPSSAQTPGRPPRPHPPTGRAPRGSATRFPTGAAAPPPAARSGAAAAAPAARPSTGVGRGRRRGGSPRGGAGRGASEKCPPARCAFPPAPGSGRPTRTARRAGRPRAP